MICGNVEEMLGYACELLAIGTAYMLFKISLLRLRVRVRCRAGLSA